jgi:hypothetical protein
MTYVQCICYSKDDRSEYVRGYSVSWPESSRGVPQSLKLNAKVPFGFSLSTDRYTTEDTIARIKSSTSGCLVTDLNNALFFSRRYWLATVSHLPVDDILVWSEVICDLDGD